MSGGLLTDLFFTSKGNHNCESIFETNVVTTDSNYKQSRYLPEPSMIHSS